MRRQGLALAERAVRVRGLALALGLALLWPAGCVEAEDARPSPGAYRVEFGLRVLPDRGTARASIAVSQSGGQLEALTLRTDPERYFDFEGPGQVEVGEGSVQWVVPKAGGTLRYVVRVDHVRGDAAYDAHITSSWALLRAEDAFPPTAVRYAAGATSTSKLRLRLPPRWDAAVPFVSASGLYTIEQPHRHLAFPKGWMLLGDIDVTEAEIAGSKIRLASPDAHAFHAEDVMALLRWNLPELRQILQGLPREILIVSAADPMWRGGLSGPGSLYVHADRPLIEPDGSSPILHELIHVVTHANAGPDADWIVEGLAELYSLELLRRSHTVDEARHRATVERMERRGRRVSRVTGGEAMGAVTARAVGILYDLDAEIREATDGARSLDDVLRRLAVERDEITEERFRKIAEEVADRPFEQFFQNRVPR